MEKEANIEELELDKELEDLEKELGNEHAGDFSALMASLAEPQNEPEAPAPPQADYRVYYFDIDFEFRKSKDCEFSFEEVTLSSPCLPELLASSATFLATLSEQCQSPGPSLLCSRQQTSDWISLRKTRLTSSLFGRVAKRRKLDPPASMLKFVQNHLNPYRYQGVIGSLDHGRAFEAEALQKYTSARPDVQVKTTGVWSNSRFPWLGGSPDGLVFDRAAEREGVLEIKCPSRSKGQGWAEVAQQKGFYMEKGKDGQYRLDRKHEYYYQVQGCMNLLGLGFCDFAVYTGKEVYVERIEKDEAFFAEAVRKLREFYFRYFLPYNAQKPVLEEGKWRYKFLAKEVYDAHYNN